MDLVPHITYVVSVNFIHEWRNQQFKVDSERQIFKKLFMAILFALREEIFFSHFRFDV